MTIASDTSFYVDSAIVNFAQPCASSTITEKIVISPNPAADKLTVLIAKNNAVKAGIEIYSVSGQKVYSINNQAVSRSQTFLIPMKQFSPGIYLVSVFIDNKKTVTKKIIRN
jgi:hypothetical protein